MAMPRSKRKTAAAICRSRAYAPEAVIIFPSPDDPTSCLGSALLAAAGLPGRSGELRRDVYGDAPVKTFWSQKDVD
jgi:hypothetical protein